MLSDPVKGTLLLLDLPDPGTVQLSSFLDTRALVELFEPLLTLFRLLCLLVEFFGGRNVEFGELAIEFTQLPVRDFGCI